MPQGKFKKAKVPDVIKKKQLKKKSSAFTRRFNAPIQPKKHKFSEQQKLKSTISKTVNKSAEEELRSRASESNLELSKAQQTVAKHNKNVLKPEKNEKC